MLVVVSAWLVRVKEEEAPVPPPPPPPVPPPVPPDVEDELNDTPALNGRKMSTGTMVAWGTNWAIIPATGVPCPSIVLERTVRPPVAVPPAPPAPPPPAPPPP